jgi:type III restriction enzyme
MANPFFDHPILNTPYAYPGRHWELDEQGQPTQQIVESRRKASFITPIPKPKKRKSAAKQQSLVFDEGKGLSTQQQQYDSTSNINDVRAQVDAWRQLPESQWGVTPETARLLQHWRHHTFSTQRPFFCQVGKLDLLILDELGYVPASKAGAELLFDVIATAYERNSLIVTTNLPFENWTEVLGSERLTGAALDRLTHRCHILETQGESYRLQDAKRRRRRTN